MDLVKPIYQNLRSHPLLSLLNTTIRFVNKDNDTRLAYARNDEGVYAFVLYYRIRRSPEADEALKGFHKAFAEVALELGGTFYLPYRHHYGFEEMEKAYGRDTLESFLKAKQRYDPGCLFNSIWFRAYGARYASDDYREKILRPNPASILTADITPFVRLAILSCILRYRLTYFLNRLPSKTIAHQRCR